jgi:hypothetical protein
VGTHVRKWISKLDPFQDLTFEKKTTFSGPATNIIPLSHVFVEGGTLFRTTNAEIDPLMLNFNDFHIPKQDTRVSCLMSKTDPFSPDFAVAHAYPLCPRVNPPGFATVYEIICLGHLFALIVKPHLDH